MSNVKTNIVHPGDKEGVAMSSGNPHPSWERLLFWLIAAVIGLELLADVLPRLLVPLVILAAVAGVLRLTWFYTNR